MKEDDQPRGSNMLSQASTKLPQGDTVQDDEVRDETKNLGGNLLVVVQRETRGEFNSVVSFLQ